MNIHSWWTTIEGISTEAFAIALIVSGLLACFFGYRLFKVVLGVTGFIAGGALVWTLLMSAGYQQAIAIAGAALGALLGAFALFALFAAGVFLFGSALGLLIAVGVHAAIGSELNVIVAAIAAVVSGLVTLIFRKILIVVSTAMTGSWAVVSGVAYFVEDVNLRKMLAEPDLLRSEGGWYFVIVGIWFVVGIGGLGVQLRRLRRPK